MSRSSARLTAAGYGAGWSVVKALPDGLAEWCFRAGAQVAFRRRGPGTVQLARNLHRVLGKDSTPAALSAVTGAALRSYARYWRETFRLPSMDLDAVAQRALDGFVGLDTVLAEFSDDRGVVFALPHSGNWDIPGLALARTLGSITTVAERLKPESLYDKFVAFREQLGFEVLPLTGGPVGPSQVLKERLRQGKAVCLLADRDLSTSGVPVTFFGEATRMPAGPAMLAAVTGSAFVPVHVSFTDTGWTTEFGPKINMPGVRLREQVQAGTQLMADFFASRIAEHPADWHMMQPLWLSDLPPSDSRRAEAPGPAPTP